MKKWCSSISSPFRILDQCETQARRSYFVKQTKSSTIEKITSMRNRGWSEPSNLWLSHYFHSKNEPAKLHPDLGLNLQDLSPHAYLSQRGWPMTRVYKQPRANFLRTSSFSASRSCSMKLWHLFCVSISGTQRLHLTQHHRVRYTSILRVNPQSDRR
jgi:hypothetical protein